MSEEEDIQKREIADGIRVTAFLDEDAIKRAFAALDLRYWKGLKTSKSADEQASYAAKARVLDELQKDLRAIVDSGKIATATRERQPRR